MSGCKPQPIIQLSIFYPTQPKTSTLWLMGSPSVNNPNPTKTARTIGAPGVIVEELVKLVEREIKQFYRLN